jgi:helicase
MMVEDGRINRLLELLGHTDLYPAQKQAISHGLLEGKNLLVTSPTASGKTLIAIMASIKAFEKGMKVIYLTPLRALALEKYYDLRVLERLEVLDRKVRIKIASSDYHASATEIGDADALVLTNEKMNSLIRHGVDWLPYVGLFVVDEVHLIGESERGPTLEMILALIRKMNPHAQILSLSATISNSLEIARWLNCDLIETKWRPTSLLEGVYENGIIHLNNGNVVEIGSNSNPVTDVALECVEKGGQTLIFAGTRKRAYSLAVKAAEAVQKVLDKTDKLKAARASVKVRSEGEDIELTSTLSKLVSMGVAFHHAGLGASCRGIVEDAFKKGVIKVLVSTPTLASGVNLPARRVVISSILRYDMSYNANVPISILEYKQLCGRAGRPKYDTFGEAIIIAETGFKFEEVYERYIDGEPEPVRSQLINDRELRAHLLGAISTIPGMKKCELHELFTNTLCAQQYNKANLASRIDRTVAYLESENLVRSKSSRYVATNFGRQTSLMYINPSTAVSFRIAIESLDQSKSTDKSHPNHTVGLLHLITSSDDFYPKLSMRKKDVIELSSLVEQHHNELFSEINEFESTRSLLALYEWINESNDRSLYEQLAVEPGDMHRMVEVADWLVQSLYQVAKLFKHYDLLRELQNLQIRIKYGIKDELVPLVRLEDIGRVRARALYNSGLVDGRKVAEATEAKLSSIPKIGPTLARRLKLRAMKKHSYTNI